MIEISHHQDLSQIRIEEDPPPLKPSIDAQLERLLCRMQPAEAIVLPASVAYLALIKALGMGMSVAIRQVLDSSTNLRVYRLPLEEFEKTWPRASIR